MKFKTTKADIKQGYYYIIGIGYCQAQNLLHYKYPVAYSAGVYGWSCDYYEINSVCISTGYNYINNKNTNYNYELLKEYDNKACSIICNNSIDYKNKMDLVDALLIEFTEKCKK